MPDVRPANVVPLLAGTDLIIEYVDFSDGLESAIQIKNNPALYLIQAVKNMAIFSLPFYADSDVLEYPAILRKWTAALRGE